MTKYEFYSNMPVDRLYYRDGQAYWVKGYRIFSKSVRIGKVSVIADNGYRPLNLKEELVRPHRPDAIAFSDLFGSSTSSATILRGVQLAEKEDLSLGVNGSQTTEF